MTRGWADIFQHARGSVRDLAPIVIVIAVFQFLVLKQPLTGVFELGIGVLFVVIGLTLFVYGLELALFPIGESLAVALAQKGSALWLVTFAFLLGFGTTIAEPALTAVAGEASRVASGAGSVADVGLGHALRLDLDRHVLDWRLGPQPVHQQAPQRIVPHVIGVGIRDNMGRQGVVARGQ